MIKAVLIDDEPLARTVLKEYLKDFPQIEVVHECSDGFEGVKAIMQHQPDLVFLDIQMPKINGFEMLELIETPPAVIFTTAYDEYAIRAFETHAIDYLLKPFGKERFSKAIEKYIQQSSFSQQKEAAKNLSEKLTDLPSQSERVVVKNGTKIKIIPVSDIIYLEAADDYVKIQTTEGQYLKNKTMSFFEQALPQTQFVRTHRSYIINIREITRLDPYEKENHLAILKTGARIPVSKTGYSKLKAILGI